MDKARGQNLPTRFPERHCSNEGEVGSAGTISRFGRLKVRFFALMAGTRISRRIFNRSIGERSDLAGHNTLGFAPGDLRALSRKRVDDIEYSAFDPAGGDFPTEVARKLP